MILLGVFVSSNNGVVESGFNIPALIFRHLREMLAAIQSVFFAGNGQENDRPREFHLAENTSAFQADGGAAAIVIRAGSVIRDVRDVGIAGIVVSRYQHDALAVLRVRAL